MAQLKDLLISGPSYFNGSVYFNKIPTYKGIEFALNNNFEIKTGNGLSGGAVINFNSATAPQVTISHADTSTATSLNAAGTTTRTYISSLVLDDFGHVTSIGTGTETNQDLSNYKTKQTAVGSPDAHATSTAIAFIDTITQNANGVITPTKKKIPSAGTNLGLVQTGGVATLTAGAITAISEAGKVTNALSITVGGNAAVSYDGSAVKSITIDAAALGLTKVMQFLGTTTTNVVTNANTGTITVDSKSVTAVKGDVVLYSGREFVWNGSKWVELGDEGSHVLKTRNVGTTGGLTGGGTLEQDLSLSIADSGVTTAKINNGAVTTAKLASSAVTAEKLGSNAVLTAKINDGAVTTAKIADTNVTTAKIANSAIISVKLADNAVTTAKITDANVTGAKIANSAIGYTHLNSGVYSSKGNRSTSELVIPAATGEIHSEKYTVTSGETKKATMQYDTTLKAIKFVFT